MRLQALVLVPLRPLNRAAPSRRLLGALVPPQLLCQARLALCRPSLPRSLGGLLPAQFPLQRLRRQPKVPRARRSHPLRLPPSPLWRRRAYSRRSLRRTLPPPPPPFVPLARAPPPSFVAPPLPPTGPPPRYGPLGRRPFSQRPWPGRAAQLPLSTAAPARGPGTTPSAAFPSFGARLPGLSGLVSPTIDTAAGATTGHGPVQQARVL